jgi:hypothetical protein
MAFYLLLVSLGNGDLKRRKTKSWCGEERRRRRGARPTIYTAYALRRFVEYEGGEEWIGRGS